MRVSRFLLFAIGLAVGPAFASSADGFAVKPFAGNEIRVEVWNHHVYVPASVNGSRSLWFLLDTGAGVPVTLIDDKVAASIRLRTHATRKAAAIGGSVKLALTMPANLTVGSATIKDAVFAELPLRQQQEAEGHEIDGILGYDFFRRYTVDIDYPQHSIALSPPAQPSHDATTRMWIEDKVPHIFATVVNRGENVAIRIIVDTGEDTGLLLDDRFYKTHKHFLVISQAKAGRSLGGVSKNARSQVDELQIGDFSLRAVPVTVNFDTTGNLNSPRDAGLIGGEVLERLHIVLDYTHGQLTIIRPSKQGP
jgi:predicted aspartyl protease